MTACSTCGVACKACEAKALLASLPRKKLDLPSIDWTKQSAADWEYQGWFVDSGWREALTEGAKLAGGPDCRHMQLEERIPMQFYACADCGKSFGTTPNTPFRLLNVPPGKRRCHCVSLYSLNSGGCSACNDTGWCDSFGG